MGVYSEWAFINMIENLPRVFIRVLLDVGIYKSWLKGFLHENDNLSNERNFENDESQFLKF